MSGKIDKEVITRERILTDIKNKIYTLNQLLNNNPLATDKIVKVFTEYKASIEQLREYCKTVALKDEVELGPLLTSAMTAIQAANKFNEATKLISGEMRHNIGGAHKINEAASAVQEFKAAMKTQEELIKSFEKGQEQKISEHKKKF